MGFYLFLSHPTSFSTPPSCFLVPLVAWFPPNLDKTSLNQNTLIPNLIYFFNQGCPNLEHLGCWSPEPVPFQNAPPKKRDTTKPYLRNSLEQLRQCRLTIKQYWRSLKAFFFSSSSSSSSFSTRVTEAKFEQENWERDNLHSSSLPSTQNQLFAILEKQHRKL